MIEDIKQLLGISTKIQATIDTDLVAARKQVTDLTAALETERAAAVQAKADLATASQTIGSLQAKIVELETERAASILRAAVLLAGRKKNVAVPIRQRTDTACSVRGTGKRAQNFLRNLQRDEAYVLILVDVEDNRAGDCVQDIG